MKKIDVAILIVFVLALVVLSFLGVTQYDMLLLALGAVIALVSGIVIFAQYKKMNELTEQ